MATEVNFYHLTKSSLEDALPRLLQKTLQAGERAVVLLGSPERVDALNTHLWTYDPNGFLPHGSARDGEAERQPVWLTHVDENPNKAAFLFVGDRARSEKVGDYKRCFELFDGRDGGSITAAQFLQRFVQEGVAWAHIDIAGVAWSTKGNNTTPKGATGFGVRLLDKLIADNYER